MSIGTKQHRHYSTQAIFLFVKSTQKEKSRIAPSLCPEEGKVSTSAVDRPLSAKRSEFWLRATSAAQWK